MKKCSASGVLIFRISGFIISTAGILLHMLDSSAVDSGFMVRHKLAYFTIQTNIFIALMFGFLLVRTAVSCKRDRHLTVARINPSLQAALSLYISMTMLGFWLILAPVTGIPRDPFLLFSTMLLHTVTPLLAIADYVFFARHGELKASDALKWLAYPLAYLVFVMLFSRTISEPYYGFKMGGSVFELMYPYPFLDPALIGAAGVLASVLALAAVFYLLGRLLIFLDRKAAERSKTSGQQSKKGC